MFAEMGCQSRAVMPERWQGNGLPEHPSRRILILIIVIISNDSSNSIDAAPFATIVATSMTCSTPLSEPSSNSRS
jgi:hypothetical protein